MLKSLKYFEEHFEANTQKVKAEFSDEIEIINQVLDTMYFISNRYLALRGCLGLGNNEHLDVISSTVFKNLNNIYAILNLTIQGNVGAARIIMRNVFEFFVLGKYIPLYNDSTAREKWDNIESINLDRRIFNNTVYPNNEYKNEFLNFWKILCQYTHATRTSGQIEFAFEDIKVEIQLNFGLILLFLQMLYHFINKFLATPYIKSYIKQLPSSKEVDSKIQELKSIMDKLIKPLLSESCLRIYKYYIANWKVETPKAKSINSVRNCNKAKASSTLPKYLRTQNDVYNYIDQFIDLYQSSENEGLPKQWQSALLKYMKRLLVLLDTYTLPDLTDDSLFFSVEIRGDRVSVDLCRKDLLDDCNNDEKSFYIELSLLELKGEYLTVNQYATKCMVSDITVRKWIRNGKLRFIKRIGGQYLISELNKRPERYYSSVCYHWASLPKHVLSLYPELKECNEICIMYDPYDKSKFKCTLSDDRQTVIVLTDAERAKLEYELIHCNGIDIDEFNVMLVPN